MMRNRAAYIPCYIVVAANILFTLLLLFRRCLSCCRRHLNSALLFVYGVDGDGYGFGAALKQFISEIVLG